MARPTIEQVRKLAKRDPRLREGDLELDTNAKVSRPDPKEDEGGGVRSNLDVGTLRPVTIRCTLTI